MDEPAETSQKPDIALTYGGTRLRAYGVSYSLDLFKALAARLGPGTVVDVSERSDGSWVLYHHRPGNPRS